MNHKTILLIAAVTFSGAPLAKGQAVINTLTSFNGSSGNHPYAAVTLSPDGSTLYGTTTSGGATYGEGEYGAGYGEVFSLPVTGGTTTVLVSFDGSNGQQPFGGLTLTSDGSTLYGTASGGGANSYGEVFSLPVAGGAIATLASFNGINGGFPDSGLIVDNAGNMYGTASGGGAYSYGAVFKLTPAGVLTALGSFNFGNGCFPNPGLVADASGNLYGTTEYGGSVNAAFPNGCGTAFKVAPDGTVTTLVAFDGTNGGNLVAGLIGDGAGNLLGTAQEGGAYGHGTVFQVAPDGTFSTLASLNGTNGSDPCSGLIQDAAGNLYGTTFTGGAYDDGTVFKLTPNGALSTLVSFDGSDGQWPYAGLIADPTGNLYGTTVAGGNMSLNGGSGDGTVFELTNTGFVVPEPVSVSLMSLASAALLMRRWRKPD